MLQTKNTQLVKDYYLPHLTNGQKTQIYVDLLPIHYQSYQLHH